MSNPLPFHFQNPNTGAATLAAWTDEDIQNATPEPLLQIPPDELGEVSVEGIEPAQAQPVGNVLAEPYKCVGLLYFFKAGKPYFGTASLIAPNIVITAAHNVYGVVDGVLEDAKEIQWMPAFTPPNQRPFRTFPFRVAKCALGWEESWKAGNPNYHLDYAMISLGNNTLGQTPYLALGSFVLGLATNLTYATGSNWTVVGYNDNQMLQIQNAPYNGTYKNLTVSGSSIQVKGYIAKGGSGGPWIQQNPTYVVNGVTSQGKGLSSIIRSPYFTGDVLALKELCQQLDTAYVAPNVALSSTQALGVGDDDSSGTPTPSTSSTNRSSITVVLGHNSDARIVEVKGGITTVIH